MYRSYLVVSLTKNIKSKIYKCLTKKLFINFGPQHQLHMGFAHGVELNGEVYKIVILIWLIT